MIRASVLSIGDELLLGETIDTNAAHLAQALVGLGIRVRHHETSGDELGDIIEAFRRALNRSRLVLSTGGLGPTDDDLTQEALAQAVGVELEYRPEVLEDMARLFNRPLESFNAANRKQAWVPKGSRIIRNEWGTAPCVHLSLPEGREVFLLPGVPREMKELLSHRVLPWIDAWQGTQGTASFVRIGKAHTFGIPESVVGERIKPLMQAGRNPDVGTKYSRGVITVRAVAMAPTAGEAEAGLDEAMRTIRAQLADGLYGEGEDTLASATLRELRQNGKTVALAESCTAGAVASQLAENAGASAALLGGVVAYANEAKVSLCGVNEETLRAFGAVSEATAREMAEGVRARFGADIGLAITGVAGPGGGTPEKPVGLVWFALATASGTRTLERKYTGLDRNTLRERSSLQGLDLIRREAMSKPGQSG